MFDKTQYDLVDYVRSCGIEVINKGRRNWACCPFHTEKTPSFIVDQTRYHCFGCGESGDILDFIQKLKCVDIKEAMNMLGVTPDIDPGYKKRKVEKESVKLFRQWESRLSAAYGKLIVESKRMISGIRDEEELEIYAGLINLTQEAEYHLWLLVHGSDKDKYDFWRSGEWKKVSI